MIFLFTVPIWLGIAIWIIQAAVARNRRIEAEWQAKAAQQRFIEQHKKCPECAEFILREAKVCKHCGAKQPETVDVNPWRSKPTLPAQGNRVLSDWPS